MPASKISALLVLGALLVVGSILLRIVSAGKYEIKTIDLVFLVIPLFVVALATGKLKEFDLLGVKADLSSLWAEAAKTNIQNQVTGADPVTVQDAVQVVETAPKAGVQELQRLLSRHVGALEFTLGHGGYYAPAIKTYLEALSGSSHLRAVIVNDDNGKLFGMYNAPDLISSLRVSGEQGYRQLQELLNSASEASRAELAKLPGFVGGRDAVTTETSKRLALQRMENLNTDTLPVINEQGRFIGTVGRAKVTAGLILAVTNKLEGRAEQGSARAAPD